jgi:amidase
VRDGLKLDAKDLAIAERKRQEILMRFGRLFQDYDFLVTPAAPVLPYPVEWPYPDRIGGRRLDSYMDWVAPAFLVTLVGFPAVSVPAGLSSGRLPVGMQIIGRRFAEAQILSLAKLVHQASSVGWPSMFSDAAAESRSQGAAQYGGSD